MSERRRQSFDGDRDAKAPYVIPSAEAVADLTGLRKRMRTGEESEEPRPEIEYERGGHEIDNRPCEYCGRRFPEVWFAPNELWNEVMGGPGTEYDPGGVLCVSCFAVRAETAGHRLVWTTDAHNKFMGNLLAAVEHYREGLRRVADGDYFPQDKPEGVAATALATAPKGEGDKTSEQPPVRSEGASEVGPEGGQRGRSLEPGASDPSSPDQVTVSLSREQAELLVDACRCDWKAIESPLVQDAIEAIDAAARESEKAGE